MLLQAEAELEEQPAGVSGHGQVAPIKVRGTSLLSAAGSSPQAGPHTPSAAQAGVSHSAEVPAPLEQPGIAQQVIPNHVREELCKASVFEKLSAVLSDHRL